MEGVRGTSPAYSKTVVKREQPRWLDAIIHIPVLQPLAAGTTLIQLTALPPENYSTASTKATNETTADMAARTEGICNYTLSSAPNLNYSMDSNVWNRPANYATVFDSTAIEKLNSR
ncbi:unnamed protein product [Dibothriocephalus latus]|uniref:Uncharacterized protein n=1 Tax=Dibothriocephalus latus TaxID=60516 RepID=A0A3P6UFW1_DIBLA|nr:unnamed protein product [Dibothriocephalus latus]